MLTLFIPQELEVEHACFFQFPNLQNIGIVVSVPNTRTLLKWKPPLRFSLEKFTLVRYFYYLAELDGNFKDNNLSVLAVNVRSITVKLADMISNLNLAKKRFTFIINVDHWLTDESNFVLEINGYK